MESVLSSGQIVLLIAYIVGSCLVATVSPILTYFLTKPHLERVAGKVEEVAQAVNGATVIKVADAYAQGAADEKAKLKDP